jgi:hypothetical protein
MDSSDLAVLASQSLIPSNGTHIELNIPPAQNTVGAAIRRIAGRHAGDPARAQLLVYIIHCHFSHRLFQAGRMPVPYRQVAHIFEQLYKVGAHSSF